MNERVQLSRSEGKLPYRQDLFVGREMEIRTVVDKAGKLQEGRIPGVPSHLVFRAEKGAGASWLAEHLHQAVLPKITGVEPYLIKFEGPLLGSRNPDPQKREEENEATVGNLLFEISSHFHFTAVKGALLQELRGWFSRDLERWQQTLVLICDGIDKADWGFLNLLDKYLLSPVADLDNFLSVMTTPDRLYPFDSPYLRVEIEKQDLKPFTLEETKKQLGLQKPQHQLSDEEIFALGGGHPLNNLLLANIKEHRELDWIINALLGIGSGENKPITRDSLEALSVLQGFREQYIPYIFPEYLQYYTGAAEVRKQLIATNLLRWQSGAFWIDESVRLILENHLRLNKPQKWKGLHQRAMKMYEEFSRQLPRSADFYTQQAQYHRIKLEE